MRQETVAGDDWHARAVPQQPGAQPAPMTFANFLRGAALSGGGAGGGGGAAGGGDGSNSGRNGGGGGGGGGNASIAA